MSDLYRITYHDKFTRQTELLSMRVESDPDGIDAQLLTAALDAIDVVERGDEAKHAGERLGFSSGHYDLRDCAEIKVEVLDEHYPDGRSMGPSHRLIYREFEPTEDDPRPIRQVIAFEHRKGGRPFKVAAERLGRSARGRAVPELEDIPNTKPATGRKKDPHRPVGPYRMPLPPDLAAVLSTAQRAMPTRTNDRPVATRIRTTDPPARRPARGR